MELPLSYSFSKHNKFTLTNSKSSSILHVCGNLNLSTLSEIQDLLLNKVERKNYSEEILITFLQNFIQRIIKIMT